MKQVQNKFLFFFGLIVLAFGMFNVGFGYGTHLVSLHELFVDTLSCIFISLMLISDGLNNWETIR